LWKKYACSMYSSRSSAGIGVTPLPAERSDAPALAKRDGSSFPRHARRPYRIGARRLDLLASDCVLHLAVQPFREIRIEERAVVPVRNDLDDRIAAQRQKRLLQKLDGSLEVERIILTGEHVELALEFGSKRFPVALEDKADVILLPRSGHFRVDRSGR